MARVVRDDVPTIDVVWQAATRIGKTSNAAEIHRLTEYLVGKHWFQTAGDLRAARQVTQEWQALEVPARLKIAIQEVLDECQAIVVGDTSVVSADAASSTQTTGEHSGDWYTETSVAADGSWSVSDTVTASEDDAAANAAAWAAYYAAQAQYDQSTVSSTMTTEDVTRSEEVVEAHAVEQGECVAGLSVGDDGYNVATSSTEWSCGQCTFLNSTNDAFCAVCYGHISLSPSLTAIESSGFDHSAPSPPPQVPRCAEPGEPMPCDASDAVDAPVIEIPMYVSIPEPAQPSSPLFAPTAPDFELLVLEENTPVALDVNGERAKQLAFGKASSKSPTGNGNHTTKRDAVSTAVPVSGSDASNRDVDFLALAFNAKSSLSSIDCARPPETDESLTEFSF